MKLGIDFHGVLNTYPSFCHLTHLFCKHGHEVHIMTGNRITPEFEKELVELGVHWTHLFSITDYHAEKGVDIVNDSKGNPWLPSKLWNPTKAVYAEKMGIDFIIDDSEVYGKFFHKIPYLQLK